MRAEQLMRRDPAMAALMGAMPRGSDFGEDFGDGYGDDMGDDDVGADFGDGSGEDVGADYGAEFGRARRAPPPAVVARVLAKAGRQAAVTRKREFMLNPNKDSTVKVEEYSFVINITNPATGAAPVFATASALSGTNTPDVWIKPKGAILNVPTPGLVLVTEIKVGNVSGT